MWLLFNIHTYQIEMCMSVQLEILSVHPLMIRLHLQPRITRVILSIPYLYLGLYLIATITAKRLFVDAGLSIQHILFYPIQAYHGYNTRIQAVA